MDRNMNYDEKQLPGEKILSSSFYLYRFLKYVSYSFPIINVCNPGVHYETPCSGVPRGDLVGRFKPPRNSEVLTKLNRIPSSLDNISVLT
jgi:hypothetical protein